MPPRPPRVYLYAEPAAPRLDVDAIAAFIGGLAPALRVEARPAFAASWRDDDVRRLATIWARAKVRNPFAVKGAFQPLAGEIAFEERRLTELRRATFGLLYDGFELQEALADFVPPSERGLSHLHIIFTNQLLGTFEPDDRRYHARVCVLGWPSLLSTSGAVDATAKPRAYYLLKQQYAALGMADAAAHLDAEFAADCLVGDDARLTEVMKGYVAQAVFYHVFGEAFCDDADCRLFNAHWQVEMLRAQLGGAYEFCPHHRAMLAALR